MEYETLSGFSFNRKIYTTHYYTLTICVDRGVSEAVRAFDKYTHNPTKELSAWKK